MQLTRHAVEWWRTCKVLVVTDVKSFGAAQGDIGIVIRKPRMTERSGQIFRLPDTGFVSL
jgi:hypothetical protein